MMLPGWLSTRVRSPASYFRVLSSAKLMIICILPVGRTRSRACACTSPLYCQIRSTNGSSSNRGVKRWITPGLEAVLSSATALAIIAFRGGEEVRDVAVDLRVEGEANVSAGHFDVGPVFVDAAPPVDNAVGRRVDGKLRH